MMKNKLDTRVMSCFGSINFSNPSDLDIKLIESFFNDYTNVEDYFFIKHDDTETLHIHYLLKLNKQVRLSTLINFISTGIGVNPLAINIDKCRGFNSCLRYMLHIDDSSKLENKKIFSTSDIISNRSENEIITLTQCDDEEDLSWESLVRAVVRYSKTSDLIKHLGLKAYHKYRFEIRDLLEEKMNSPKFNMDYAYLNDDVPF